MSDLLYALPRPGAVWQEAAPPEGKTSIKVRVQSVKEAKVAFVITHAPDQEEQGFRGSMYIQDFLEAFRPEVTQ